MQRNHTQGHSSLLWTIGNLCRDFRLAHGIPLEEIAEAGGYHINSVIRFEKGESDSMILLLCYVRRGLNLKFSLKGVWSYDD